MGEAMRRPVVVRGTCVALCFHAVEDTPVDLAVDPQMLRRHLIRMLARGFRFVRAGELAKCARETGRWAAVTFDDGYRSVHERALSVLESLNVRATVFPTVATVAGTSELRLAGLRPMLSWDELRDLQRRGWEIGSHTVNHVELTRCSDAQLDEELREARERIEAELSSPCRVLAYPYGSCDPRVMAAARAAGYRAAFTVPRRWTPPEPLAWPRVNVWRHDTPTSVALKSSRVVRAARRSRLGSTAFGAARAFRGASA